ncbi:type II secretion system protein [Prosthecobacter vanneervenii]|uniref:Prepilin-type N-terminal cleavage/methylation domain-containing protein n=1 Tax=Prosthecobacter vanneervenii TaxID=48466 RepID=A0A7W7Y8V3_9BACT|nr:type II secretion system protein [Prosthecobacter vanneervenii]MBB5031747.1 prepilin-type N-terminal cleavage/methylation domain-containing protein [Prosthecobacter vanneervenii]
MTLAGSNGNRTRNAPWQQGRCAAGFSMTELVIVISILSVLAAITVNAMNQYLEGGKIALTQERQEMLNRAVYTFAQQNYQIVFSPMGDNAGDELAILRTLQYRDPNSYRAKLGSPYIDPRYNPGTSSSTKDYRLQWTGKVFKVLEPGDSGSGLLMNFDGTDFTTPFAFPPDFQMAGN